jgi:D-lactate dehydrogenase (cytochrome)
MSASELEPQSMSSLPEFLAEAACIVGDERVLRGEHERRFYSTDFSEIELEIAAAVVRPQARDHVVGLARAAARHRVPLVARGGGMSYTLTYVPSRPGTVVLDMTGMNRILEIDTDDLRVTVEPGVTWKQLHAALLSTGYRIPFIGTYSGEKATVGGGLGNNATGHGALDIGDYLLGLEVVLPDGRLLQTGARAHAADRPGLRGYGPDLTGLFTHDAGAFGIKTAASFRLVRRPPGVAFRTYGFRDEAALIDALCAATRLGVATEVTAFGEYHHRVFAQQPKPAPAERKAIARSVIATASSRWRGYRNLAEMARGLGKLRDWPHSATVICDDWTQRGADDSARAIDRLMRSFGAPRLPAGIGIALRAQPFFEIGTLMVGLDGESSFPSNFTVPLSLGRELARAAREFFAENAAGMQQHGVHTTTLYLCIKGTFGMEPIIYWPDRLNVLRHATALPVHREKFGNAGPRPAARAYATDLRHRLVERLEPLRPAHYQTGKYYPLREAMAGHAGWDVVQALKSQLDPHGIMNPGALGLD